MLTAQFRRVGPGPLTRFGLRATILVIVLALVSLAPRPSLGEAVSTSSPARRLHALFAREWEYRLRENPLLATSVGRHEYDDRLPSMSAASLRRRYDAHREFLTELHGIDPDQLSEEDRISYRIFEFQLDDAVEGYELGDDQLPLTSDEGFYIDLSRLPQVMTLRSAKDYRNYIARLRQLPRYFDEQMALMRQGAQRGFTLPRVVVKSVLIAVDKYAVDDATSTVFWAPFANISKRLPEADREALQAAGRAAISEAAIPAYQAFQRFMHDEYFPASRQTIGATDLPNGRRYYQFVIHRYTSLDMTPEAIHELGSHEVERIHGEMQAIIRQVGFEGSFQDFLEFLRTDPRFYAKTPDELLKDAAWIAKQMDGKLPALFKTLPRLPYTVEPVPDQLAPRYTSGRYVPPAHGSTQPGIYWVNTYDLPSRPLYTLEALTFHEAVPGHHLQGALADEASGLPPFRRFWYLSAYGEGWGLYAEWLGLEAGFYHDPYSNFGRLTYEMWRACRLVVDTGLHAMGWSRQRAIAYMTARTALSHHEIETEVDRYISWPGQALSYKLGELTFKRLRHKAEKALGPAFDVRTFHDAVLLHGAVTLPVLEELVDRYIDEQTNKAARANPAQGDDGVEAAN
jgi:uncharacterized protein (DUF885 family)